jgi:hypothetical protein
MITTKWLRVSIAVSVVDLLAAVISNQYARGMVRGFDLGEVTRTKAAGRFIEQITQTTTYLDPFGEYVENTFTYHKIFSFELIFVRDESWLLRIDNPPRSLKSFVNFLTDICANKFSVEAIQLPILGFLSHPRVEKLLSSLRVNRVMVSGINFGPETYAKADIRSTADALREVVNYYSSQYYVVDKIFGTLIFEECVCEVEISRLAVISSSHDLLDELNPICVDYLSSV